MNSGMTYIEFSSRFRDKKYIGSGGFAKVYKVFDHAKSHYVALKVADVRPEFKNFTLLREVELVNSLPEHPNIARYEGCFRFDRDLEGEVDYAILKFYEDGNLDQFLKTHQISDEDKHFLILGILEGIRFLHEKGMVHRDLKSQNILIQRDNGIWTPKITDFGLSRNVGSSTSITNSSIGLSYAYAAPEQILNEKKISKNVDLWAAGVIIYRILAGELPFQSSKGEDGRSASSQIELTKKIINLELPDKLFTITEPYQGLIRRCLVLDPKERARSADELIAMLREGVMKLYEEEQSGVTVIHPPLPKKTETPLQPHEPVVNQAPEWLPPEPLDYMAPNPNKTVVIEHPYEAPPASFQAETGPSIKVGEQSRQFPWVWVLLPLILICIGGAVWFGLDKTEAPGEEESELLFVQKPTSVFDDLREKNDLAQGDPASLVTISEELKMAIKEHPRSFEPMYILAQNQTYQEQWEVAFFSLRQAVKRAVKNGQADAMKKEMIKDGQGSFKILVGKSPENWDKILKSLDTPSTIKN